MVLRVKTTLNYKKCKGKNTLRMCLSSVACCAVPSTFPFSSLLEHCRGWHRAAWRESLLLEPWHQTEISARRHKNLGMLRGWEGGVSPRAVLGSGHLVRVLWMGEVGGEQSAGTCWAFPFVYLSVLSPCWCWGAVMPWHSVCEPAGTSTAAALSRDTWMLWNPVVEEAWRHPAVRSPRWSCRQMVLMFEKPKPGFLQAHGIP